MISILIPTYNYNIVKLVTNLQKQCAEQSIDYEIIVLDDSSSNKKLKIHNHSINSFDRCKYIESDKNRGRTASRDFLAREAMYDWLLFLDADVMPKYKNFIHRFVENLNKAQLIFGGIAYTETKPSVELMLRWKYGHSRESLTLKERNKEPYLTIISGCFFIKKDIFISINQHLTINKYGLDNVFKQLLEEKKVSILHIDNPVYHLGLEKNELYISKALRAVETTVFLENKNLIKLERPLQKTYLKLKQYRIHLLIYWILNIFEKQIFKNLKSKTPSLFLFDLYRLTYYIKLKKDA
ncbi:glycosyltransferase family 2 protein [uncultured Marixanthomonas sp.]|uniref:glycosyltransferase family 2 protein n=1 Tax=uncultured Marixanthomonas sp. TaxID=757245 RepID=UPI0030DCA333|tara:strand:+ start:32228 stop:33115 length:888 start_codon:yes stop_codon:yes gene_type:complete